MWASRTFVSSWLSGDGFQQPVREYPVGLDLSCRSSKPTRCSGKEHQRPAIPLSSPAFKAGDVFLRRFRSLTIQGRARFIQIAYGPIHSLATHEKPPRGGLSATIQKRFATRTVRRSSDCAYLALLFGNNTRSGAAFSVVSNFLINLVLTRPASFG